MARMHLQRYIRNNGGNIISEGTLKTEDLLGAAHECLTGWGIRTKIIKEIEDVLCITRYTCAGYGGLHSIEYGIQYGKEEDAEYLWNDKVIDFLNLIAPKGYSFGSSEGDGACIGWFKYEEEM